MKRGLLFAVLLILFIGFCSSLTTDLKEVYAPGETAIVKITGAVNEPIAPSQVEFKRDGKVRLPLQFDIKRLGDNYYLWFINPMNQNNTNMTLIINDISTIVFNNNEKIDLIQNFTIFGENSEYNIWPGFGLTRGEKLSITIGYYKDEAKDIEINFPYKNNFRLAPGENKLELDFDSIQQTQLLEVRVGKYNVPVFVTKNVTLPIKINNSLVINPKSIFMTKLINIKEVRFNISLLNDGDNKIEGISIKFNKDYFTISPDSKITLLPNEQANIEIKLKENIRYNLSDTLVFDSTKNNITISVPIEINFAPNRTVTINVSNNETKDYDCEYELAGKICDGNLCNGTFVIAKGEGCCIGECGKEMNNGGESGWIGYAIIGIAVLVIVFAVIKYRKVKPGMNDIEKAIKENKSSDLRNPTP